MDPSRLARADAGPVVRGCGLPVAALLRDLAAAGSFDEVLRLHPGLEREDLAACVALAAEALSPTAGAVTALALAPRPDESATLAPPNSPEAPTLAPGDTAQAL